MKAISGPEERFAFTWKALGGPEFQREYAFHPQRRWRFDFAWPEARVAVEIEGGLWKFGRHNHPQGFMRDLEKYNEAIFLGWVVFRLAPDDVEDTILISRIMDFIRNRIGESNSLPAMP